MGRNPATSVVNPDLRVHGVDNLYLSGSAVFVTCGAGSPTLLLTALGVRLGDHLRAASGSAG
jgi:choline dehydrogenase-like flavoprotein